MDIHFTKDELERIESALKCLPKTTLPPKRGYLGGYVVATRYLDEDPPQGNQPKFGVILWQATPSGWNAVEAICYRQVEMERLNGVRQWRGLDSQPYKVSRDKWER